jgi:hypothetical protein
MLINFNTSLTYIFVGFKSSDFNFLLIFILIFFLFIRYLTTEKPFECNPPAATATLRLFFCVLHFRSLDQKI